MMRARKCMNIWTYEHYLNICKSCLNSKMERNQWKTTWCFQNRNEFWVSRSLLLQPPWSTTRTPAGHKYYVVASVWKIHDNPWKSTNTICVQNDVKHEPNAVSETMDLQIWKQNHRMLRREMNLERLFSLESASRKLSAFANCSRNTSWILSHKPMSLELASCFTAHPKKRISWISEVSIQSQSQVTVTSLDCHGLSPGDVRSTPDSSARS